MIAGPISVTTVPIERLTRTASFDAPATVVARNEPLISAEIEGRIQALPVKVGDRVGPGDLLARLDCRLHRSRQAAAQAELDRTDAGLRFAERQLKRARDLKKTKNISAELLDQRQTELATGRAVRAAAAAALDQAAIATGRCNILAPFDAVVRQRHAGVGDLARPGTPVLTLIETRGQEVRVELRNEQLASFQTADTRSFTYDGQTLPLSLRALVPASDTRSLTREARLSFDAEQALPGTAGRLRWNGPGRLLPATYLVRRNGQLGLFTIGDGKARFVPLPGAEEGRPAMVGLPAGTPVVTDGRQRLSDGDEVSTRTPRLPSP